MILQELNANIFTVVYANEKNHQTGIKWGFSMLKRGHMCSGTQKAVINSDNTVFVYI